MKKVLAIFTFLLAIGVGNSYSQGTDCASADPFCTNSGATFPASTSTTAEVGPDYGCLFSQPNPAWYFLQIDQSGNIDITLTNDGCGGGGCDIDFICWGPFASLTGACNNLTAGNTVDCSYSTAVNEVVNIPNAQTGEFYLVLITNFSGQPMNISANQTGGAGTTDCSIVNPCVMTGINANIGACVAGTFDITGDVTFTDPPTTGQLIVETCSGDQTAYNPPFNSPLNFSITGITADGTTGCDVTAYFTDDPACTISTGTFTEPVCNCFMTSLFANIGACDPATDAYMVNGDLDFQDPPAGGTLVVSVDNGTTTYDTIINPPFVGPYNWSVSGIPSDGAAITITAYFTADPTCTLQLNSTAPASCQCSADAGTFGASITGDGTQNYLLCFGDEIDITSNNDYTSPQDLNIAGITYDPGLIYLVYECPPTVFPTNELWDAAGNPTDPCLLGVASWGDDFNDQNFLGGPSYAGNFTDNTVYYVPITTYSNTDGYYAISINGGPWCYGMGTPFAVQYLPEVTSTQVEDCVAGTLTVTVNGGQPELDGSNFTASNLLPGTASFGNTTCTHGGTIVINGLQDGDMYSFDITDGNGCPHTITGGPFVGNPTADAGTDDVSCTLSYTLGATPSIGTGTWTSNPAGAVFAPNANTPNATVTVNAAGSYTFTWTEDNGGGCVDSDDVVIQFSDLSYVDNVVQSTCGNADGEITLTANDGIPGYNYSITGAAPFQTNGNFTGLVANTYNILIEDAIGCQVTGTATVTDQGGPTINSVVPVDITCNGLCDGSIAINATGATQFSIDNGNNFVGTSTFNNLCQGTYDIIVQDANGCQATDQAVINEPTVVTLNVNTTDLLCANICTGEIDIIAGGGMGTISYSIDNGNNFGTGSLFQNLCAGPYDVVVEDGNGCQANANITINEPAPLSLTLGITDASCNGMCDGMINSIPAGGDGNYSYTWGPAGTGGNVPLVSNLCVGPYSLTIQDGNGCTIDTTMSITGPAAVTIDNIVEVDELCGGDCSGEVTVNATGATEYSLDGSNWVTNNVFTGLCAGAYTVYVQDATGCGTNAPANISGPSTVTVQAYSDTTICIGGTAVLTSQGAGGVGGYTYSWDSGDITQNVNVSPATSQTYCVTATDANGCPSAPSCVTVSLYQPLSVVALSDQSICAGDQANISAIANGGDGGPYNYTWDQGVGAGAAQTVAPGVTTTYTVSVTDGCETPAATASVDITINPIPVISFSGDTLQGCLPLTVNFTDVNVPAGSTCLWSFGDGGTSQDCGTASYTFTQPGCWDVTLSIITPEGCQTSVSIPSYVCVFDYPVADFVFGPQPTSVLNTTIQFTNTSIDAVTYDWTFDTGGAAENDNNVNPTYTFPNSDPGTYETCLIAYTAEGCPDTTCHNVVINEEMIVYVPNAFTPDGDEVNNIFIPVTKGVDPLNYEFLIFNRWGELIFEGHHPSIGWDGKYKGVMSQTDVYVWKLKVKDMVHGDTHEYIGHVTLLK